MPKDVTKLIVGFRIFANAPDYVSGNTTRHHLFMLPR